eukprot:6476431-Amphidinium_carterae.2
MKSLEVTCAPNVGVILRSMTIREELRNEVRCSFPPQRGKTQSRLSGRIRKEIIIGADGDIRDAGESVPD